MEKKDHWDRVYEQKEATNVSWYQPHLKLSLDFFHRASLPKDAAIIDIGGGASTWVDDLLAEGYTRLSVLDISQSAIDAAKWRLGERADLVQWWVADITNVELPAQYFDFWHDRAVFHFLTSQETQHRYVETALRALKPGAHIVVATFGLGGPEQCSGLPVVRYDADGIHETFGDGFLKVQSAQEQHQTPWGTEQEFVYCYCLKTDLQEGSGVSVGQ